MDAVLVYDPADDGADIEDLKNFLLEYDYSEEEIENMSDSEIVKEVESIQQGLAEDAAIARHERQFWD